jgi:hypothetical protein
MDSCFRRADSWLRLESQVDGSPQKLPESASLQLAAPGSFDSVVACAPTPLKMTEGKWIRAFGGQIPGAPTPLKMTEESNLVS